MPRTLLAICFRHLDGVAAIGKEAIWAAGSLPFEVRTTARRERPGVPALPAARGYLSISQRSVQSMSTGAVRVERG